MNFKGKEVNIPLIKELSYEELGELSYAIRQEIIRIVSKNGGHLSSNLGVVELELALARFFDFPKDKLIIDVGHQSYTYKIITGRNMNTLRLKNGVSGFQKRDESPFDVFEAGHSSTSLSAALGMAITRDLSKDNYHIIALIGDASIMSGMALEALNDIGSKRHKVIIVLNDNNMSVSKTVGALHSYGNDHTIYHEFGLDYIGPINGHHIEELENSFKKAVESPKSVVIHVHTEKGKGYPFAEDDTIGTYHGISPFKVRTGEPINHHVGQKSYASYFGELIDKEMGKNKNLLLICPAMIFGSGLQNSFLKYPRRTFDVGIAEEHSITLASGMALNGYKPLVVIYSTFLQRAFDQVSHDMARMNLPILLLVDRSGLVGEDGETHQGLYDEAFLMNTPNITLVTPSDMKTSKALFHMGISYPHPFVIRYPRGVYLENDHEEEISLSYGKWIKEMEAKPSIAFISLGHTIPRIKERLVKLGIHINIYNAIFLKPIDEEALKEAMENPYIIIVDIMATRIGFVNYIASKLEEYHYKGEVYLKAVKDEFIKQASFKEQLSDNDLDDDKILELILNLYQKCQKG